MLNHSLAVLILSAIAAAGQTGVPSKKTLTVEAVTAGVSQVMPQSDVRDYVICQIRPAVWAGYDVELFVDKSRTTDQVSRVFKISKGTFTIKKDPRSSGAIVEVSRSGIATVKSKEDAFAQRMPFFIGDVSIEPPDLLHFTVYSNPSVPITGAMVRHQRVRRSESGYAGGFEVVESNKPFDSAPGPLARTFKANYDDKSVLSIVTYDAGSNRCLVSNEIPLAPFLAGSKPAP